MSAFRVLTAAEQVAAHLRAELAAGRWHGSMPGAGRLEAELEVGRNTVEAALRQLESEGLLVSLGGRRRRRIQIPDNLPAPSLRIAILVPEASDLVVDYVVEIQHRLEDAGHKVVHAARFMLDLGMDVRRIARMVDKTEADAWVVGAGSREVLEWFATRPQPVFALFGRQAGLDMAGTKPNKPPLYAVATRHLIDLGHRRIVLLARSIRRLPEPGVSERAFLGALEAHGIATGTFNIPDWEESIDGFHERLSSLFQTTPPTALIIQEAALFAAAHQFLAGRGIRVPEQVSLICTDACPTFAWFKPPIAHIRWDSRPVVRCVVRWAGNVSRGKRDVRQTLTPAEFVAGGTIGPAPPARHR